ncbi:hypothetical protein [Necropsobacter massiliensis]|uniref:hypothetical protein n=1 Tax=Necropsobacter massiliensis TaxID=1400001 RepID=UPI000595AC3F|nr:hypothetical protein [Necropsobacter massiliensis]
MAVGLAPSYLNQQTKEWTVDKDDNVNKLVDLVVHTTLGVIGAKINVNNALVGSATAGKVNVMIIAKTLYRELAEKLTEVKKNIAFLS